MKKKKKINVIIQYALKAHIHQIVRKMTQKKKKPTKINIPELKKLEKKKKPTEINIPELKKLE